MFVCGISIYMSASVCVWLHIYSCAVDMEVHVEANVDVDVLTWFSPDDFWYNAFAEPVS